MFNVQNESFDRKVASSFFLGNQTKSTDYKMYFSFLFLFSRKRHTHTQNYMIIYINIYIYIYIYLRLQFSVTETPIEFLGFRKLDFRERKCYEYFVSRKRKAVTESE